MIQPKPHSIAIYARTATVSQGESTGLDAQEARCRREAARRGVMVMRVFRDEGSGLHLSRPGLDALRAAVADKQVTAIIVDSPGRLARDGEDYATLLAEWRRARVVIIVAGQAA